MDNIEKPFQTKHLSILDGDIKRIDIYKDEFKLTIDIFIKTIYSPNYNVLLRFEDVQEYSFLWDSNYSFYYIEVYKYLIKDNLHYISFNPKEDEADISAKDQDYILSKNLVCFYGEKSDQDFIPVDTKIVFPGNSLDNV